MESTYQKFSKKYLSPDCGIELPLLLFAASLQEVYKQLPLKHRLWATHLQADCINMERLKERGVKVQKLLNSLPMNVTL